MDRSVSVLDLSILMSTGAANVPVVATLSTVATERLSAQVLLGKQLFYDARDPRLARDAYMSCASCHNDGGQDGRVWDLTGFGEGLRNTVSLEGRAAGHGFLHWSANFDELQDFEGQIRTLAGGSGLMSDTDFNAGTRSQPLGDRKTGLSASLDALAAYVASLSSFSVSPYRNSNGSLTTEATAGRAVFVAKNCAQCHSGSNFTASQNASSLVDIGTLQPSSGQRLGGALAGIDPPTLRDVWRTGPWLHNGSALTLQQAVAAHTNVSLTPMELDDVVAYVREIGSEERVAPGPSGNGLVGQYFNNKNLTGIPVLTRVEAVNFNWGTGSPAAAVNSNQFSVRWTGFLQAPTSGAYRLRTYSDDGIRVWLNGSQIINNWTDHAPTNNTSGTVNLTAGQRYSLTIEYYENGGGAVAQLRWRLPNTTGYQLVPASQLFDQ
jgi:mono/diheme cytochrome c family protein